MIDVAKGGGIISVVFVHGLSSVVGGGTGGNSPIVEFFYSFLYMFFFMSGYVHKPGRTPKENIIRMSKKFIPVFILCAVVLTLIMWAYLLMLGYNIPFEDVVDTIVKSLIGKKAFTSIDNHETLAYGGLCDISYAFYFIVFLYVASIIFYLLVDKVGSSLKRTLITVAILLISEFILLSVLPVHLPYCIEGCLIPAALMFIGYYAASKEVLQKIETEFLTRKRIIILIVMLIIGIFSAIYIPLSFGLSSAYFGKYGAWSVFTALITVLSCGYVIFTLFAIFERIPIFSGMLEYCGKHSLSILMLHAMFLKMIAALFYTIPEAAVIAPFQTVPEGIIASIISIVLCLITSYILRKIMEKISNRTCTDPVHENTV